MRPTVSNLPLRRDIALYGGDGVEILLRVRYKQDGSPYPLDGGDVASHIRARATDPEPLAEWTIDASEAAGGLIELALSGAQTRELLNGHEAFLGVWDVSFDPHGAEPLTLVQGNLSCLSDVTR